AYPERMTDATDGPNPELEDAHEALPSRPSAGGMIAGILGTIEAALTNRPRPVAQIEERYREPWATANGITVEGLEERIEHPEPPDTSGAKL
ncbi:MAG: hypothetical protein ACRDIL_11630, partial [Candidatus Limnocylindrales bacterium]